MTSLSRVEEALLIQNPVLKGFHPDPSFIRVGDDYYLATSTFEWFPGVPIYHSRDLMNWRPIGHALTRASQLDLRGIPDSGGVWAPALSHHDGLFHLIYSIVRTKSGAYKDVHNYLVTADDITGPWSEPIFLNSSGFDPSLFHDDDGRKWLLNVQWDHRKNNFRFNGIALQEYDPIARKMVGPIHNLLKKDGEVVEGPNLYKVNGWYYLMTAEGGTGFGHRISMARARSVAGPYELDPQTAVITSHQKPELELAKAGHGELVETPDGEWFIAHLCARPLHPNRRSPLGRETALQRVTWSTEGWLRLENGGTDPRIEVPAPRGVIPHPWPDQSDRDDFDTKTLASHWCSLRVPFDQTWGSLTQRPGWLRLSGRESLHSLFEQSLLGRRQQSFECVAQTCIEFEPTHYSQMAGLVYWYNTDTHYYLRITHDESLGKVLEISLRDLGVYDELRKSRISIAGWRRCFLRAVIDHAHLQFRASPDGEQWCNIGPVLDASKIADDYNPGFTGAFVGICAQDLGGTRTIADFDYFELREGAE